MSETSKPKDPAQQNKFIELEGPEYLEEGMNFFAQPPFDKVLEEASTQSQVENFKGLRAGARKALILHSIS